MAEDEKNEALPEEPEALDETESEAETPVANESPGDDPSPEEVAAEETSAEPEASADAEPSSASAEPKRKRKRLPRRLRPEKARPRRGAPGARKPIVRDSKPEHARGRRQERRGVVVSSAMDKTIVVEVELIKSHPRYKKVVRRSVKFHAHDEQNVANVGDLVRIVETRPLSATKRWRLVEVLEAAK